MRKTLTPFAQGWIEGTMFAYLVAAIVALILLLASCDAAPAPVGDSLKDAAPAVTESANTVKGKAASIVSDAKTIQKATTQPAVVTPARRIEADATAISGEADKLIGPISAQLANAQRERDELQARNEELVKDLAAEKDAQRRFILRCLAWGSVACFLIAALGAVYGWVRKDLFGGVAIVVGGTVVGGLLAFFAVHFDAIMWTSIALAGVAVIVVIIAKWRGWFTDPNHVGVTKLLVEGKTAEAIALWRGTEEGAAAWALAKKQVDAATPPQPGA